MKKKNIISSFLIIAVFILSAFLVKSVLAANLKIKNNNFNKTGAVSSAVKNNSSCGCGMANCQAAKNGEGCSCAKNGGCTNKNIKQASKGCGCGSSSCGASNTANKDAKGGCGCKNFVDKNKDGVCDNKK